MTGKWTIKKYSHNDGKYLAFPWLLFAPGITPPKTIHETHEIEYPQKTLCSSQAQALKEIKTIKLLYAGDPT